MQSCNQRESQSYWNLVADATSKRDKDLCTYTPTMRHGGRNGTGKWHGGKLQCSITWNNAERNGQIYAGCLWIGDEA